MPPDSADDSEATPELEAVLGALDDPDSRAILRAVTTPMTAREIMDACDLPQTTTYRKLDGLTEAGLVAEETEVRADGHHETRYGRAVEGVMIGFAEEDQFDVQLVERESAADRLARLWTEVSDEL